MQTEPTLSYQDQLGEAKARVILWLVDQLEENPIYTFMSLLLVVIIIIPMVTAYLRCIGITKFPWFSISEKKPNNNRIESRISTCPAPRLSGRQCKVNMHKKVLNITKTVEDAHPGDRFRYCVVCSDEWRLECYAVQFYEQMKQTSAINHYGWIYYDIPKDKTLQWDIEDCLLANLRICPNEKPKERFDELMDFFDDAKLHTLLVIRICQRTKDRKLAQLANLEGLSLVLFSETPVDGYETIEVSVKGGK